MRAEDDDQGLLQGFSQSFFGCCSSEGEQKEEGGWKI